MFQISYNKFNESCIKDVTISYQGMEKEIDKHLSENYKFYFELFKIESFTFSVVN